MPSAIGAAWLIGEVEALTDEIERVCPSLFNEEFRYLPESVSSMPGPLSFDINPFMREIVDCVDMASPVREVNLMKGVQITYTTALESMLLYLIAHVGTVPCMYMTADKELAQARVENNIIPMINESGFSDKIRSSDVTNKRKTGKTAHHIQWEKGGYLVPFGAKNADKMRSYSILALFKDELDAWPDVVGKDGDPDALSDARCSAYYETRKIFRGSTPLIKQNSKIYKSYLRGDQRKYFVKCLHCGHAQALRWSGTNDKGAAYGFAWDLDEDGILIPDSVRYLCEQCGGPHYEHDKTTLFDPDHGAEWVPTAKAKEPNVRSYHLPALYSPLGMQPWYKCVSLYLEAWDVDQNRVKDVTKYQVFYNNILAEPFTILGSRVTKRAVSSHKRPSYRMGQIPNDYADRYSGSKILFLTCTVDVHRDNLAVAVFGWTVNANCYLVDYWRFEDENCETIDSPVWDQLRDLIENRVYSAGDGHEYNIMITGIDAGYCAGTVSRFCSDYESGVFPIIGRESPGRKQRIQEFYPYKTQSGLTGFKIWVDHYKDRLSSVLRREWHEDGGPQPEWHFNAPIDVTDKQLEELTKEIRRERVNELGIVTYEWYRPGNARNELWDLLVYGHALVEVLAWQVCVQYYELDQIDWPKFWEYLRNYLQG